MDAQQVTDKPCIYHLLDGDIHQFTLQESTRDAVDGFISVMQSLSLELPADDTMLILFDVRASGVPPLRYFSAKVLNMMKTLQQANQVHPARTAILYRDQAMLSLLRTGMDLMSLTNWSNFMRAFDDRDAALNWLALQSSN